MISQLDIYVDTQLLNPKILVVKDASFYNPDIEVSGGFIEIQYPGSNNYVSFDVLSGFTEILNSNTLGITNVNSASNLADLPDGIYTIKYAICPYDELFVELTFLRNTLQLIDYVNAYCKLDLNKCSVKDYDKALSELQQIYALIKAAEYSAYCCKYEQAITLYNKADSLLEKLGGDCNCH